MKRTVRSTATKLAGLTGALLCAQPARLHACAVCYGQSDSPLARGLSWGILVLLAVLLGVLAGVVGFFVHMSRRAAARRTETILRSPVEG